MLVIHASAIEINNEVILFIGRSGSGKSSLSASFHNKYNFITEDIACIEFKDNNLFVRPGPPLIKLTNHIPNYRFSKNKR